MRLPGSSAGHVGGACLPCTGRGLASRPCRQGRWWALTPPFHPYLSRLRRSATGGLFSVPLSVGFRRLSRESVLPCGVRTFLDAPKGAAVTRPACRIVPAPPFVQPRRRYARAGASRTRGSARAVLRGARTPRRPGTRVTPRAVRRGAPARAIDGEARHPSQLPEHPH